MRGLPPQQYTEYHDRVDDPPDPLITPTPEAPARPSPPGTLRQVAGARSEAMRSFGMLGSVGLSFVVAIVLGCALGIWLDRVTKLSPLFTIVGLFLGFAAGVRSVYVTTKRFMK
jgi:ATP synthase protein I